MYSRVRQRPTHLLFAAVDLPFLLIGQGEHGLPVLIRKVQFILQQQGRLFYPHSIHSESTALTIQLNLLCIRSDFLIARQG